MKNKNTDPKLHTNEVIELWAALEDRVYGEGDSKGIQQHRQDEFAKLMSRHDISDVDRLWLRFLAERDLFWLPVETEPPAIA